MTTATTPRQPAKRAKGRAHWTGEDTYQWALPHWRLYPDEYEETVERMARAMWSHDWPEAHGPQARIIAPYKVMRDIYRRKAIAALKSIGIAAPRKERKK